MSRPLIYLAGPMAGLTHAQAGSWREDISSSLLSVCDCINPLRGKGFLSELGAITTDEYPQHPLTRQAAVVTRDRFDVQRCDLVLMNLHDADRISIGTMVELGWANAYNKPIVLIMNDRDIHNHIFTKQLAGWICTDLSQACEVVRAIFELPSTGGSEDL